MGTDTLMENFTLEEIEREIGMQNMRVQDELDILEMFENYKKDILNGVIKNES